MQIWSHFATPDGREAGRSRPGRGIRRRWFSISDKGKGASNGMKQNDPPAPGTTGTGIGGVDGLWAAEQGLIARKHRELGHM